MTRIVAACAAALLVFVACGGDNQATDAPDATPAPAQITLPSQLLGLNVVPENISGSIERVRGAYFDSLGLYSFRQEDDLLRATLQIGRFNDLAEPEKKRFRDAVIAQLGSTVPEELRVGDKTIWLTSGNEQNIFAWFDAKGFYVLSIRSDYQFPRMMLRRLMNLDILA